MTGNAFFPEWHPLARGELYIMYLYYIIFNIYLLFAFDIRPRFYRDQFHPKMGFVRQGFSYFRTHFPPLFAKGFESLPNVYTKLLN